MKKIFIFILAVVYLAASTGVIMQRHYCMNRLVGWSLSQQEDDMCSKCGMDKKDKKKGCCNDETIKVKISEDQQSGFTSIHFESPVPPLVHDHFVNESLLPFSSLHQHIYGHGPPGDPKVPLFLRNNVFRI
ncbi:MAG: hypothetical protein J0L56_10695 [Chitinophagales bacterium]|nr:hypothetical protein [Chitinophagales bacterium]